jgi:PAS domain S-box-containing protein/diguanylate cyclase (GGDEF)-like protein
VQEEWPALPRIGFTSAHPEDAAASPTALPAGLAERVLDLAPAGLLAPQDRAATLPAGLADRILHLAPVGVLIAELREGEPLVYVNAAFEAITGYGPADALGRNCRYLQGSDRLQAQISEIREAVLRREAISVLMRNYRRDGRLFWNALHLAPICASGTMPTHYVGLMQDVTALKETTARLEEAGRLDRLTGALSRYALLDRITMIGNEKSAYLLVIKVDVARFHDINSGFGHESGDVLLKQVAERLRGLSAEAVGRVGSDEFAVVFRLEQHEGAEATIATVAAVLAPRYVLPGAVVSVRFAIGYVVGEPGSDPLTLLRRAGTALHESRATPLRELRSFDTESEDRSWKRIRLANELQLAVLNGDFVFDYQPKVEIASGKWIGGEALLRWRHPLFGLQMPDRFIGLAEDTGLIVDIGAWGVRTAAAFAARLNSDCARPLRISVNVSATEFVHRDMISFIEKILDETRANPRWLTLELTESLMAEPSARMQQTLRALRDLGVGLSIDDFGTGYSSLRYLETLPVTEIKIDRGFVQAMSESATKRIIVEAVVRLGQELGAEVVAEGIETEAERAVLCEMGCPYGQGYLFSRPLPPEAFLERAATGSPVGAPAKVAPHRYPSGDGRLPR